jgi:hypothetical protein
VSYWHRTYGWNERWHEAMAAEAEQASWQGRQMMRLATPLIAQTLLAIIGGERPLLTRDGTPQLDTDGKVIMVRGGTDKDAINAAKLMLAYNLGDPRTAHYEPEPDRPLGSVLPATYTLAGELHDPETPEELAALKARVSELIEATVQAVNTRPRRSRKRV